MNSNVNFVFFHSQNCTIKCACLTSHYEGASSAQSKTEETGLKRLCVRVCVFVWAFFVFVCVCGCLLSIEQMLMCEWVQLFVFAELVQYGSVDVWICCLDECLRDNWEGEDGDQIQSMDLEIPQDHPVMLLN